MGLDQYAYWKEEDDNTDDWETKNEISYWRKHHDLQSIMERIWYKKLGERTEEDIFLDRLTEEEETTFNCVELQITEKELSILEDTINGNSLFCIDIEYDEWHTKIYDLEFIRKARELIKEGKDVFYDSSW